MPNWCANRLTVETPLVNGKNPLAEFLGDGGLTFEKVAPSPKLVKSTAQRSERDRKTGKVVQGYMYAPNGDDVAGSRMLTPAQVQYLQDNYGAADWYNWNLANWGTKWDIDACNPELSGSEAVFDFETAWGPPEGVALTLSKLFGGCTVTLDFFEAGCDFGGRTVYRDGKCVSDEHLTARASRDISDWHEAMYGYNNDDEDQEEGGE
jgi:hypothetical protein